MPVLKNARHEAFCQAVAKGKTQEEAYAAAGYKPSRHHASRLATKGNVVARVSEIKSRVAEKVEWGAAERIEMLRRIADAHEAKDPRVTVSAIAETNRMTGAYAPVKQEIDLRTTYTDLSDDELRDTILKLMQRSAQQ